MNKTTNPLGRVHNAIFNPFDSMPSNGNFVGMADIREELDDLKRKLSKSTNLKENEEDKYGDGDQSPVKYVTYGDAGECLRTVWTNGCELSMILGCGPHPPPLGLSEFFVSCALGLAGKVLPAIEQARGQGPEALRKLLERRETILHCPPLIACIAGSRLIGPDKLQYWPAPMQARADHTAIAKAMIAAGVNVHAKDAAGKTVLHHAFSGSCSPTSRRIGVLCIEAGADARVCDRFGTNICHDAIISSDAASFTAMLEAGADPGMRNHLGSNKMTMLAVWPEGMDIFRSAGLRGRICSKDRGGGLLTGRQVVLKNLKAEELNGKTGVCGRFDVDKGRYTVTVDGCERAIKVCNVFPADQAPDPNNTCSQCGLRTQEAMPNGQVIESMMKCSGCFAVRYCSRECQKLHWKGGNHKVACKELAAKQVRVLKPATERDIKPLGSKEKGKRVVKGRDFDVSGLSAEVRSGQKPFPVKIQVPVLDHSPGMPKPEGQDDCDRPLTQEEERTMRKQYETARLRAQAQGDMVTVASIKLLEDAMEKDLKQRKDRARVTEEAAASGSAAAAAGKRSGSNGSDTADKTALPVIIYNEDQTFVTEIYPGEAGRDGSSDASAGAAAGTSTSTGTGLAAGRGATPEAGQDLFSRIVTVVRRQGMAGVKAYAQALLVREGSMLVLDVADLLGPQEW